MFWDSVCPSFTGNTLSSTNWLSPLLGGHCCLRSSIQKFKKVVHILCSPRQRPGSQGIIFRVRLIWRHKAYMKGWKQVTIPFLLSDGFQSFIKLLHTKERERESGVYNCRLSFFQMIGIAKGMIHLPVIQRSDLSLFQRLLQIACPNHL